MPTKDPVLKRLKSLRKLRKRRERRRAKGLCANNRPRVRPIGPRSAFAAHPTDCICYDCLWNRPSKEEPFNRRVTCSLGWRTWLDDDVVEEGALGTVGWGTVPEGVRVWRQYREATDAA